MKISTTKIEMDARDACAEKQSVPTQTGTTDASSKRPKRIVIDAEMAERIRSAWLRYSRPGRKMPSIYAALLKDLGCKKRIVDGKVKYFHPDGQLFPSLQQVRYQINNALGRGLVETHPHFELPLFLKDCAFMEPLAASFSNGLAAGEVPRSENAVLTSFETCLRNRKRILDCRTKQIPNSQTAAGTDVLSDAQLIGAGKLAGMLDISVRKLDELAKNGDLPRFLLIGKSRKWRLMEIKRWITEGYAFGFDLVKGRIR